MEGEELETKPEDTLYDILMKGANAFADAKPDKIEYVSVTTRTNFGPQDPTGIRLFATFGRKGFRMICADVEYPIEHEIPDEAFLQLFEHFPRKRFELEANQSIEGWGIDRLIKENPVRLTIDAPISWGFVESTLPQKANWIDASLLTGVLKELGIRYSQNEHLIIKPFKYKSTSYDAILSTCKFFKNHKFKTKLKLGSFGSEIRIQQDDKTQSIEYSVYSLPRSSKTKVDKFQEIFEKYLGFTASGRSYELFKELSRLKEKGMKIDYQ